MVLYSTGGVLFTRPLADKQECKSIEVLFWFHEVLFWFHVCPCLGEFVNVLQRE